MMNTQLFQERKEIKKRGHFIVRSHYFILVFLTLLLILYGKEFNYSNIIFSVPFLEEETDEDDDEGRKPGYSWEIEVPDLEDATENWQGDADEETDNTSPKSIIMGTIMKKGQQTGVLGQTEGVLARFSKGGGTNHLFWKMGQMFQTLSHGTFNASMISIILAFLWFLFIFTFVLNVYSAAIRRVFLEARVYPSVPIMNILYFTTWKQWLRTAWTMLVKYILNVLWLLTIIGGAIKFYSYWAVPYIVAENPELSPKEAITLSRKLMNGHKLELFLIQVSFLPWYLLGTVTLGISDIAYGVPYRMACYGEFYARIREKALAADVEGSRLLQDSCLFEPADKITLYETYFHVIDEISLIHENKIELKGVQKLMVEGPGIWIGSIDKKRTYDEQEGRKQAIRRNKAEMTGEIYPRLLCPFFYEKKNTIPKTVSYLKSYTLWDLFLIFISISFIGWSWEVALHLIQTGEMVNRGTFYGPWLPIYGTGALIVLIFCNRFRKNPFMECLTATLLCGGLEYTSAWFLETRYHQQWWSYKGYFLNLHGRICAEGLLLFGAGCCFIVYILAPLLEYLFSRLKKGMLIALCLVLLLAFGADTAYSIRHPNMANGAIQNEKQPEMK